MFFKFIKIIKLFFSFLEKVIFPKSCFICNKIINNGYFCDEGWNKLQFLSKPACNICFQPFEFSIDDNQICPNCVKNKPSYFKCVSVLRYDQSSKKLITKFKYLDQGYMAKYFAKLMLDHSQGILDHNIDFIIPVPLHKLRLISRRYNQSALIVRYLSKLTNIKATYDLLIRIKNTPPQASLNKKLRTKNTIKAFALNTKYKENIKGKNILLIDDVVTTGATIESCSKVLMKAQVNKVYVLTLAKTVIDSAL